MGHYHCPISGCNYMNNIGNLTRHLEGRIHQEWWTEQMKNDEKTVENQSNSLKRTRTAEEAGEKPKAAKLDHSDTATSQRQSAQEIELEAFDGVATLEKIAELEGYAFFLVNPYRTILCGDCNSNFLGNQLQGHLRVSHKDQKWKEDEIQNILQRHNVVMERSKLCWPAPGCLAIPGLEIKTGWYCHECQFTTIAKQLAQLHLKDPNHIEVNGHLEEVLLQAFLPEKQKAPYVVVQSPIPSQEARKPSDLMREFIQANKAIFNTPVEAMDDPRTQHPFLFSTGWASWIEDSNPKDLEMLRTTMESVRPLAEECEGLLKYMFGTFKPRNAVARCHIISPGYVV